MDNVNEADRNIITAHLLSVAAAVELGKVRMFGSLPFDEEMDQYMDQHGLRG